nr:hypothetical protein [Tanacetum cinerariifolium]
MHSSLCCFDMVEHPCPVVGHEAAYGMSWKTLIKMMTDKYCPRNKIMKLEIELWELKVEKYVGGLPDTIHGSVVASKPKTMQEAIEIATELMDKKQPGKCDTIEHHFVHQNREVPEERISYLSGTYYYEGSGGQVEGEAT